MQPSEMINETERQMSVFKELSKLIVCGRNLSLVRIFFVTTV